MGKRVTIIGADFTENCIGSAVIGAPIFSKPSGQYYNYVIVEITSKSVGAEIRYTTNGSTPTTNSTLYRNAITVSTIGSTTIKAIAFKNGVASNISVAAYEIITETISPESIAISGDSGTLITKTLQLYASVLPDGAPQSVVWSVRSGNASINASGLLTINDGESSGSVVVRATSSVDNSVYSDKTIAYSFDIPQSPIISLGDDGMVSLVNANDGNGYSIHYTTDGSTPTESSSEYTSPLTLSHGVNTIKAICVKDEFSSGVSSKQFTKYTKEDCTLTGYGIRAEGSPLGLASGFPNFKATDFLPTNGARNYLMRTEQRAGTFGAIFYTENNEASIISDSGVKYLTDDSVRPYAMQKYTGQLKDNANYVRYCIQFQNVPQGQTLTITLILY